MMIMTTRIPTIATGKMYTILFSAISCLLFALFSHVYCYSQLITPPPSSLSLVLSADYTIGGYQRKGDIDFDLLAKLVMVLARGPDAVNQEDAIVREPKQQGATAVGTYE